MKVISKEMGYLSRIERYDLTDIYSNIIDNKGLVICYVLAKFNKFKFISLELEAKQEEIGIPEKWIKVYNANSFEKEIISMSDFLIKYDNEDFGYWMLNVNYQNIEISFTGKRDRTDIGVSYSKSQAINLLSVLSEVENISYNYNDYDKEVVAVLINEYKMTTKRAVLTIKKLKCHQDIYEEFVATISNKYPKQINEIIVEGFSAQKLNKEYPLSILGAYNYLIYLRENPQEAVEDLRRGLPRK